MTTIAKLTTSNDLFRIRATATAAVKAEIQAYAQAKLDALEERGCENPWKLTQWGALAQGKAQPARKGAKKVATKAVADPLAGFTAEQVKAAVALLARSA